MIKHRLNELEAQNARLEARIVALETGLAAWLPAPPTVADLQDDLRAQCAAYLARNGKSAPQ